MRNTGPVRVELWSDVQCVWCYIGDARWKKDRAFHALTKVATAESLGYQPRRIQPTNSHLALELLHHAETEGARAAMSDRLYAAYFVEGKHVGRIADLVDLAAEAGLHRERAHIALESHVHADAVDRDAARAQTLGVNGVPFSVIDDTYGISGAQSAEVLVDVLERARTS